MVRSYYRPVFEARSDLNFLKEALNDSPLTGFYFPSPNHLHKRNDQNWYIENLEKLQKQKQKIAFSVHSHRDVGSLCVHGRGEFGGGEESLKKSSSGTWKIKWRAPALWQKTCSPKHCLARKSAVQRFRRNLSKERSLVAFYKTNKHQTNPAPPPQKKIPPIFLMCLLLQK